MKPHNLAALRDLKARKVPTVLVTDVGSGEQVVLAFETGLTPAPGQLADAALVERARASLRADKSTLVEAGQRSLFLQAINPPLRMAIIGAVHISQALAPMAAILGYDVTVIDPRRAFASPERFPGINVDTEWPDDALETFVPDSRTAVITLTHDPKLDDPALQVALRSSAFYIGCLGSKRTHAGRLERLAKAGFGADKTDRIKGPIGLDIGARSPAEIAAAIVAQVTSQLRDGRVQ